MQSPSLTFGTHVRITVRFSATGVNYFAPRFGKRPTRPKLQLFAPKPSEIACSLISFGPVKFRLGRVAWR